MIEQTHPSIGQKVYFYLFINSKSGGKEGAQYLTVENKKLTFSYNHQQHVYVNLIDLFNEEDKRAGLQSIKKKRKKREKGKEREVKIVVVICGGDGTVLWVVNLINSIKIDLATVIFTILPVGTGNDFSNGLGWGRSPITFREGNIEQLKERIVEWINSQQVWYDIWQCLIQTYYDGTMLYLKDQQEVDGQTTYLTRAFCNYLGVGVDARIAYAVQQNRKSSKWLNLCLYGCLGLLKFCQKIRSTYEAIHQFRQENHRSTTDRTSFQDRKQEQLRTNVIRLKQGYGHLVALNSSSYMAGTTNVWNTQKLGIQTKEIPSFSPQRFDDGLIQFLAYKNELRLGLQQFGHFGTRVAQGQGPFVMQFNRSQDLTPTFIQIDGQAFKFIQIKSLIIRKSSEILGSRIKVLLNKE